MGSYRLVSSSSSSFDYLFLSVIRPALTRPMTELSLMEAIQDQYLTRHLPDGVIIYADQR